MRFDGTEVHQLVAGGHVVEFHEVVNVVEEFRVMEVVNEVVDVDQEEAMQYAEEGPHDAMDDVVDGVVLD